MTDSSRQTLQRIARRVPVPGPAYERLLHRRDRRERTRRISAAAVALAVVALITAGFLRSLNTAHEPATTPTPSVGVPSGPDGWITFGKDDGIWAVDPNHPETPIHLSTTLGVPISASSDGSEILILNSREGSLSVLHADGTVTPVAGEGPDTQVGEGSLSSDGTQVVYASSAHGSSSIYVVNVAGGDPRRIMNTGPEGLGLGWPAFSPDGARIAYFEGSGDHDNTLRVMDTDGHHVHVLLRDAGFMRKSHGLRSLSWSPDGFRLLFQEGYGPYWIYTVNIDGSNLTRVTQGTDPAWSQDRLRISFTRFGRTSHLAGQIWVANPDGSGARPVDPTVANNGSSGPWILPAS